MNASTIESRQAHSGVLFAGSPIIPAKAAVAAPILSPEELVIAQSRRYSTKKFDPGRVIPPEQWAALEQSLLLSPSSSGLQLWRFLILSDRTRREQLMAHTYGQRQVADASHVVVFLARTEVAREDIDRWIRRLGELREMPAETLEKQRQRLIGSFVESPRPDFNAAEHSRRQVYIALGNFLFAAALLGIDTCPMEGFDAAAYDRELGLSGTGYRSIVLAATGYRAPDDANALAAKVRFPIEDVILRL